MVKKIAFISSSVIKIRKELEEELTVDIGDISVEYRHPVLYLIRKTKRDKDYLYVYCSKPTYVIMKVKEAHIEEFINTLKDVLARASISEKDVESVCSEVLVYGKISNIMESLYFDILKESAEEAKSHIETLKYFTPPLRRKLRACIVRAIVIVKAREIALRYYPKLPPEVKERVPIGDWLEITSSEIDKRSIIRNIMRVLREESLESNVTSSVI